MRKFFLTVHKWAGLIFGVFFVILCFTGAILAFRNEIANLSGYASDHDMPFLQTVQRLHRWLFMVPENPHGGMSVGRFIVGTVTIISSLILISGIIIWWPKNKTMLKNRFSLHFNKGWRRFVYDSHVSLGIYIVIFMLLMTLTGPSWSFNWYGNGVNEVLGTGHPMEMKMKAGNHGKENKGDAPFMNQKQNQEKNFSESAKKNMPKGLSVRSLHTGDFGGVFTKLLYCLAALIGGFLPISGYYMWWKERQQKIKQNRQ